MMEHSAKAPHDGAQLDLGLYAGEPWGGRSPRGLTRVALGLILNPEVLRERERFFDPAQLELWPAGTAYESEGPPVYRGAPLLLELLTGGKDG